MLLFELEMDEHQIRGMVKAIIEQYENARYRQGSYQSALEFTQEATLRVMENTADFVEEFIEHTGTRH
jgi:hypothetical protein